VAQRQDPLSLLPQEHESESEEEPQQPAPALTTFRGPADLRYQIIRQRTAHETGLNPIPVSEQGFGGLMRCPFVGVVLPFTDLSGCSVCGPSVSAARPGVRCGLRWTSRQRSDRQTVSVMVYLTVVRQGPLGPVLRRGAE